jgi:uncharacterized protein (DUF1697 family)
MPRYVAFLRAINVGGRTVTMDRLCALFRAMKLRKVESFIASGNVIFETPETDIDALQARIEAALEKALGYEVRTFVRSDAEVAAIATHTPFDAETMAAGVAFNVGLLHEPLSKADAAKLATLRTAYDEFATHGREVYWLCRGKMSESIFFQKQSLEKVMKLVTTFRTRNTYARLAAKYPPAG